MIKFDKPIVFLKDIPEIMLSYDVSAVIESKYLGGVPNVTYRVITPNEKLAIRICNHGYTSVDHLNLEIRLLEHLHSVGFRESPVPVRGKNGHYIQNWHGYRVIAMQLIDGVQGERIELTEEISHDVGRVLSQLRKSLNLFRNEIPSGETYIERGARLLNLLPETTRMMGWKIDVDEVIEQWNTACNRIEQYRERIPYGLIHTDVWPPNIICKDNRVVGVVDFDDWAYGPTLIDIAAPLVEFPWFYKLDFDERLAKSLFRGFFLHNGKISKQEEELLLVGMEMACASWLACNALHQMQLEESEIYLKKLHLFRENSTREMLASKINRCITESAITNRDLD